MAQRRAARLFSEPKPGAALQRLGAGGIAALGVYPYPFIDVIKLGLPRVILNACALLAAFLALGLAVAVFDHALAARRRRPGGALDMATDG